MEKITVPAKLEYMNQVLEFMDGILAAQNCSEEEQYCIDVSVEELFTNIASYGYGEESGPVEVLCAVCDGAATVCLRDRGRPWNPWEKPDPDFGIPFDERPVGGLGIYMTKKFMDQVDYRYEDGWNVTTIRKSIGGGRDVSD